MGDVDYVVDQLRDVGVAFDGDGDDAAGAGGHFLDVVEGLFVLEDAGWDWWGLGWRCRRRGGFRR